MITSLSCYPVKYFVHSVFIADIYGQCSPFFLSNEINLSFIFPVVDFITSAKEFQKNQIFLKPSNAFEKRKAAVRLRPLSRQ